MDIQFPGSAEITVSAPCRIDFGGTLDIPLLHYTLHHLRPSTFNIAINMRTRVTLSPFTSGRVKISSKGFEDADLPAIDLPFDHPMGLMFAIASYFRISGVHIQIESSSPPRSALGGSSTAAIALIAAFAEVLKQPLKPSQMAILAYQIESNVARVPCGIQDQLAAAFGGVNAWTFEALSDQLPFIQEPVLSSKTFDELEKHILIAYCGVPHESKDVNGKWIQQFLSGSTRKQWEKIILLTQTFISAVQNNDWSTAVSAMRDEVDIRLQMTPDVLDDMGKKLHNAAFSQNCAARFTGAGGGGCVWAIGEKKHIASLKTVWSSILSGHSDAALLLPSIADCGVINEREKP
ncbi:galactokinase [Candidatus Magnetomorum sp. HK-1]|nr:galactokinase [Candidatus Magnetomorum sp. HK-1]